MLERLRATLTQVMRAVELLLASSLAAGLALMLAALAASGAERRREAALMRTLGASRRQLALAALAEFGLLGLLAALIAAGGALLAGELLARHAFDSPALRAALGRPRRRARPRSRRSAWPRDGWRGASSSAHGRCMLLRRAE
ncbi:MAG: FtsX-like permease family protein [Xanthomonadales bacterium]|nr:FtsX-like permease family protein [Xanthomonadales bacterium]